MSVSAYTVNDGNNGNNYTVTTVDALGVINKAVLTVTGATAQSKVYDANTATTITGGSLSGVVGSEIVTFSGGGNFADPNVGDGKAVTASLVLGGSDGGNYTLTQPTGLTANITRAPLTITARTNTKNYDGNTSAAAIPTVSGLQGSDRVTGLAETYDNNNPGTGKTMSVSAYTINDGNSGGNYAVTTVDDFTGVINSVAAPVLQPPPAAPIIVPAFPDNGIKAIANDTRPPEFGGMNYVAALFEGAAPTAAPTASGQTQGSTPAASAAPTQGGAMNYVSISSKVTDSGQELQVRLPEDKNRKPQSELNVNNTTVSSNTSPLDVFVVDTGINLSNLNNGK